jgi:hypothetical protein
VEEGGYRFYFVLHCGFVLVLFFDIDWVVVIPGWVVGRHACGFEYGLLYLMI